MKKRIEKMVSSNIIYCSTLAELRNEVERLELMAMAGYGDYDVDIYISADRDEKYCEVTMYRDETDVEEKERMDAAAREVEINKEWLRNEYFKMFPDDRK